MCGSIDSKYVSANVYKRFRKMDQILQGLWLGLKGPNDGAEGYSLPQLVLHKTGSTYLSTIIS